MMQHIADEAEHIYLALAATDFRKQQNGLAVLISLKFKLNPYCGGSILLFCYKKHSSLMALFWLQNLFLMK